MPDDPIVEPDEKLSAPTRQGGQSLGSVRHPMEQYFGMDLSSVRIHPESPRPGSIDARAYTTGRDIFFAPGEYQPQSTRGRELIAHELAHVVQQSQGRVPAGGPGTLARQLEEEAEQHASQVGEFARSRRRNVILEDLRVETDDPGTEALCQDATRRALEMLRNDPDLPAVADLDEVRVTVDVTPASSPERTLERCARAIADQVKEAVGRGAAGVQPRSRSVLAKDDEYHFKDMIEQRDYESLAERIAPYFDMDKADDDLRPYLEYTLDYLEKGGSRPREDSQDIICVRGAKNDKVYEAEGGGFYMLPNNIRYQRRKWDDRLTRISGYFEEATDKMGGEGDERHELGKIIDHHRRGGVSSTANSRRSVLISASLEPQRLWGPPFYILKIPQERAIFNYKGLSGEKEVLIPFFVLPDEVVAKAESWDEVMNNEEYQGQWKDVAFKHFKAIEENIREGKKPLEGIEDPYKERSGGEYWGSSHMGGSW